MAVAHLRCAADGEGRSKLLLGKIAKDWFYFCFSCWNNSKYFCIVERMLSLYGYIVSHSPQSVHFSKVSMASANMPLSTWSVEKRVMMLFMFMNSVMETPSGQGWPLRGLYQLASRRSESAAS